MQAAGARLGLLLFCRTLSAGCGIGRHCGVDELFEGSFVDLFTFVEVDRTTRVPFQARIEDLLRVLEGGPAEEGELHHLLVRFASADTAIMGPDGGSRVRRLFPFPLLLDVGVGVVDELTKMGESSPLSNPPALGSVS